MSGSVLLFLHDGPGRRRDLSEVGDDVGAPVPDDHDRAVGAQRLGGSQYMPEKAAAGETVQHLGRRGRLHAGALAGGEDDDRTGRIGHGIGHSGQDLISVIGRSVVAGGLGLEPRLQGSKGLRAADYPIPHRASSAYLATLSSR